jgi:hypothetical protein
MVKRPQHPFVWPLSIDISQLLVKQHNKWDKWAQELEPKCLDLVLIRTSSFKPRQKIYRYWLMNIRWQV